MSGLVIREAAMGDEGSIHQLLHELAVYENLTGKFHLTEALIARDFLGPNRVCRCDLAHVDGEPAGVMTWYRTYASFAASRGLFLEDVFVRPAHRGKGLGKALLARLAAHAVEEGATHIQWFVLDWNAPSIAFYEGLGAVRNKDWLRYDLSGAALAQLAAS